MAKNNNKIADKIASRTLKSYMMLKVPVGYSLVKNTKSLLQKQLGQEVGDDELEEVFSRFLDLVIFGLMRDASNIGSSMPEPNHFYEVAKEVLSEMESEDDGDFNFDEFRFDGDEDEGAEGPGDGENGNEGYKRF